MEVFVFSFNYACALGSGCPWLVLRIPVPCACRSCACSHGGGHCGCGGRRPFGGGPRRCAARVHLMVRRAVISWWGVQSSHGEACCHLMARRAVISWWGEQSSHGEVCSHLMVRCAVISWWGVQSSHSEACSHLMVRCAVISWWGVNVVIVMSLCISWSNDASIGLLIKVGTSFFSCPRCNFPYIHSSLLSFFFFYSCLSSFLLFPCESVWENTHAWGPHLHEFHDFSIQSYWILLALFSRNKIILAQN